MNFRIALSALLVALAGCDAPSGGSKETTTPMAQEREVTAALSRRQAYELSERCGKTAGEEFRREWKAGIVNTETGQMMAGYANHYNSRLNKCFYLLRVTHFTSKKSGGGESTSNISMMLVDINDAKEIGTYWGAPTSTAQPVEGRPTSCNVVDKLCSSSQEWEALARPYMED